jgi:tetratricopeptide (TPR) repeat protein
VNEETLDAEELLHLALKSIEEGRDADTLALVKRAIALQPENGVLHHLLGAAYAEIGLPDRASSEWTLALQLDPALKVCRFQLGLLHLTMADPAAALAAWQPLEDLPPDDPVGLFRSGMVRLVQGDYRGCIDDLRHALEVNTESPALNRDMQVVIARAEQIIANGGVPPAPGPAAARGPAPAPSAAGPGESPTPSPAAQSPAPAARHVLISGYEGLASRPKDERH